MQSILGPRKYLLTFAGSAAADWLSGIREVYGALLTLAVVAFFPFVLIVAAVVLTLALTQSCSARGLFSKGRAVIPFSP